MSLPHDATRLTLREWIPFVGIPIFNNELGREAGRVVDPRLAEFLQRLGL